MIVLGLDTSSDAAAIGLVSDGILLCEYTLNNGKNHSVKLLPMITDMLQKTGVSFPEIDAYCCGVGPGSFTGVRIGVATAKAFAQSWNKQVVPVSSLEVLAENTRFFDGIRVSCVHAREDELFCAAYGKDGETVLDPSVKTVSELSEFLSGKKALLSGNGAGKYREVWENLPGGLIQVTDGRGNVISGGAVAELGYRYFMDGAGKNYEEVAPVYLRVSQAEREYAARRNGQTLQ